MCIPIWRFELSRHTTESSRELIEDRHIMGFEPYIGGQHSCHPKCFHLLVYTERSITDDQSVFTGDACLTQSSRPAAQVSSSYQGRKLRQEDAGDREISRAMQNMQQLRRNIQSCPVGKQRLYRRVSRLLTRW
jgi:hypothetical protein